GYGGLLLTSFERQSAEGVSFGLRSQSTTPQFTQMGQQPGQRAPARVSSANVGFSVGQFGSFGLGYAIQKNRDKPDAEVVSANYSLSVGKSSALIVSAYKSLIGEPGKAVSITLSIGLGEHSSVSFNAAKQKNSSQMVAQVQQNLPAGTGTGYRLLATVGDPSGRKEAGFSAQNDIGTYSVEAGHASGITSYRASASGGVAYLDGSAYLSRRLTGSFGVVQAPDFPDIGIFVSNQLVGRTDAKGNAIMPNLLAYQNNAVSIDANELPMDAQLDATQVNVVPYYRSGVLVKFPIQRVRSALLSIVLADGQPMPLGSEVSIAGREEAFLVAERGEVYVTGLAPEKNQLRASWEGQTCAFEVSLDKNLGPVPRIGPYTCAGVHP
ncbi:MAG: fimbria/pilus outer membrane usher protein, partial [Betaproteobacteria bacterium]